MHRGVYVLTATDISNGLAMSGKQDRPRASRSILDGNSGHVRLVLNTLKKILLLHSILALLIECHSIISNKCKERRLVLVAKRSQCD